MKCNNCHRENVSSAQFCTYCGVPLGDGSTFTDEFRDVAILAVDIIGLSRFNEKYPVNIIHNLTNDCMQEMERIIIAFGGSIIRRFSIGIEAVFGAPITWERDSELATLAALAIVDKVKILARKYLVDRNDDLYVRCGIDFGEVHITKYTVGAINSAEGEPVVKAGVLRKAAPYDRVLITKPASLSISAFFDFENFAGHKLPENDKLPATLLVGRKKGVRISETSDEYLLVNRKDEVVEIRSRINVGLMGNSASIMILGDAGIGKTRVVNEAVDFFTNATVHRTRILSKGAQLPYILFRQLLTSFVDGKPGADFNEKAAEILAESNGDLARFSPLLDILFDRDVINNHNTIGLSQAQCKEYLTAIVSYLISTFAKRSPLIIIVEDAQWIDASSAKLLKDILPGFIDLSVIFIIVSRSNRPFAEFEPISSFRLESLNEEDTISIINNILPEGSFTPQIVRKIIDISLGNPLYATEYSRAFAQNIDMDIERDIPFLIKTSLQAQLDSLSANSRNLIHYLVCIGAPIKSVALMKLLTLDIPEFSESIDELTSDGILFFDEDSVDLKSVIFRDVVKSLQSDRTRAEIYSTAADVSIREDRDAVIIGKYLEKASRYSEAAQYWEKAARHPSIKNDFDKQLQYLLKAVENGKMSDMPVSQKEVLVNEILSHYRALGEYPGAMRFLQQELKSGKTPDELANFFRETGILFLVQNQFIKAISFFTDALRVYRYIDDITAVGSVYVYIAQCHYFLGRFEKATDYGQLAAESFDIVGDEVAKANIYNLFGLIKLNSFDPHSALKSFQKAYNIWEATEDLQGLAISYGNIGHATQRIGLINESERFINKGLEFAKQDGTKQRIINAGNIKAYNLFYSLLLDEANELLAKNIEIAKSVNFPEGLIDAYLIQVEMKRLTADYSGALDLLHQIYSPLSEDCNPVQRLLTLCHLLEISAVCNKPDDCDKYATLIDEFSVPDESFNIQIEISIAIAKAEIAMHQNDMTSLKSALENLIELETQCTDIRRYTIGSYVARHSIVADNLQYALRIAQSVYSSSEKHGNLKNQMKVARLLTEIFILNNNKTKAEKYKNIVDGLTVGYAVEEWQDWSTSTAKELEVLG